MTDVALAPAAPLSAARRGRRGGGSTIDQARRRLFVPFVGPAFVLYTILFVVPSVYAIWISFNKWAGAGPMEFVGFGNYVRLFNDKLFLRSFGNTLLLLFVVGLAIFVIAFALTLVLSAAFMHASWNAIVKNAGDRALTLAAVAAMVTVNDHVREVLGADERRHRLRVRVNVRFSAASIHVAQASVLAVIVFAGFVALGVLSVPDETIRQWVGVTPPQIQLGSLTIPVVLVKVSWALAGFAALYHVTATAGDVAAREAQLGPVTDGMRRALAG